MELRVLGPLEARMNGAALPLGTRKQQAVLALLAVHANQVVGIDEFVDELWHQQAPPPSAMTNVRGYVGNLRRLFNSSEPMRDRIGRHGDSYLLHIEPDELDLLAFEDDRRGGSAAAERIDAPAAVGLFTRAVARWRGRMLAGMTRGPILAPHCAGIEAQRLNVVEHLAALQLATGQPDMALPFLYEHVQTHPLREPAHALLIQALHESGDIGAALSAYATARTVLIEELGVEPGPELQRLHRAVLNRDTTWKARHSYPPTRVVRSTPLVVPHEIPAEVGYFVGRSDEARRVADALSSPDQPGRSRPAVAVLYGTGGVGKSALAVHVAHKIINSYPDGQLYVDLRGSTPGLRSLTPVEGIRHLLRSLGTPREEIPDGEADAGARLRSVTAAGRYLLVLDNATDASQIQPLLPSTNTCAVIVTARHPLAALDANVHLHLDTLPTADGVALIQDTSGGVPIDPRMAETIVHLCGHLPLALRIAAGRLLSRPDLSPPELVRRLADRERRLDELELEGVAVRSCIRVGYAALASGLEPAGQLAAWAFRAFGLLNVADVTSTVVAAMLSEPEPNVAAALDHLVSAQLLTAAAGRYGMHDLVRLVAAELAAEDDDATTRVRTLHRALAYYGATVERASAALRPGRSWVPDAVRAADVRPTEFATPIDATAWLDADLPNVAAAAEQASHVDRGDGTHFTLWLVASAHPFLWERNEWRLRHRLALLALHVEQANPDQETAGWAHLIAGQAEFDLGNHSAAVEHFEHGLTVLKRSSAAKGVALALNSLAIAASTPPTDPALAVARFNDCLQHVRLNGLAAQEAAILANLGNLKAMLGQWDDAKSDLEHSLAKSRAREDRNLTGSTQGLLAAVHCALGDLAYAGAHATDAVVGCREAGDMRRECHAWLIGAEIHLRCGDHDEAVRHAHAALSLARECRYSYAEAAALRQHAKAAAAVGQEARAAELHGEAIAAFDNLVAPPDPVLESVLTQQSPLGPSATMMVTRVVKVVD